MWWVSHNEHGAFTARGIHGQGIYIDPAAEMVIVRFASHPLAANANLDPMSLPAYDAVARHLMADKGSKMTMKPALAVAVVLACAVGRRFRSESFVQLSARQQPAVLAEPQLKSVLAKCKKPPQPFAIPVGAQPRQRQRRRPSRRPRPRRQRFPA